MTNFEMVEVLRQKANVSYEEAKTALEAANWDLLDAMLLLEKEGRVAESGGSYSTRTEETPADEEEDRGHKGLRNGMRWLARSLGKLLRIGNTNSLVVSHKGAEAFRLPVTVFAILLLCSVWTVLIAMGVSLFFGVRYSFIGPDLGKESINSVMDRAAAMAENVKDEMHKQENNMNGSN